jgi:hypothetical protein
MRNLNLNSSINALVSDANVRFCSLIRALELFSSCYLPQLRQRAYIQAWQGKRQHWMQPVTVPVGHVVGRPTAMATMAVITGRTLPATG